MGLSAELQEILLDDRGTALQNRLNVLMRVEKTDNNQQSSKSENTYSGSIKPLYTEH